MTVVSGLLIGTAVTAVADDSQLSEPSPLSQEFQTQGLYQQGVLRYEKGDFEAAIAVYTESLEQDPDSAVACSVRAGVWGLQGNYANAIADYSAAIEIDD